MDNVPTNDYNEFITREIEEINNALNVYMTNGWINRPEVQALLLERERLEALLQ